ncbi:MAG TPA: hypothetical protein VMB05_15665 [Solirubrobacteraceae bacterium]|nr:hypothetical protein [Solirubrobacteraceae bacterium]
MKLRALLATLLASSALVTVAEPALAGFGPIRLQSVGPLDQFEGASEPAIAAGSGYLAFAGTLDGVKGVFRKNLQSGEVQLVAGGSTYAPAEGAPTDASAPSISANGRYVSFTSTTPLTAAAHAGSNVYVRDMGTASDGTACTAEAESARRCAFELASALSTPGATTEGLTYYSGAGAVASGRDALSADGREVAFVIQGESNLTSEAGGSTPAVHTPGLQVAVRYLDTHETMLVSAKRDRGTGAMTELPVPEGAVTSDGQAPGASLSADGTTVAWLGAHIPAQAPTLSDEAQKIEQDDEHAAQDLAYDEPLWRRIAAGPTSPTRRIVGGGDPLAPGCPPDGTLALSACRGPFPGLADELRGGVESSLGWVTVHGYDPVPQLSADGWTAALLGDPPNSTSNAFVVDMHEGLSRVQAVLQLTREVPVPFTYNPGSVVGPYTATAGNVYDVTISPDGSRVAFATEREQFPLAPPFFAEAPLAQLGVAELYQVDLRSEALVRVTHGTHDGPSTGSSGAGSPSYTADGRTLAFGDGASNLVAGDANETGDVFTVTATEPETDTPGSVAIGPAAAPRTPPAEWRLSVVAIVHANGTATLDVVVPGAGRVAATASATVPVTVQTAGTKTRRGSKTHAAATTSSKRHKRMSPRARVVLESRAVAKAQMPATLPGLLELPLRVSSPYTRLLTTKAGVYASVRVTFAGNGGPTLAQTVTVSLHKAVPKRSRKSSLKKGGTGAKKRRGSRS